MSDPKPRIEPRIMMVAQNLTYNYGYPKMEARQLAREVIQNLDNYLAIMELNLRRLADRQSPTQTPYWKARHG